MYCFALQVESVGGKEVREGTCALCRSHVQRTSSVTKKKR